MVLHQTLVIINVEIFCCVGVYSSLKFMPTCLFLFVHVCKFVFLKVESPSNLELLYFF